MLDHDDPDLAATAVQDPWQSSEKFAACGDSTSTARALGCRIYLSGMPGSIDWPRRLGVSCSSSPEALACPTGVATQPNQLGIQNNNASASQSCLEYEVSLVSIGDAPHLGRPTFFGIDVVRSMDSAPGTPDLGQLCDRKSPTSAAVAEHCSTYHDTICYCNWREMLWRAICGLCLRHGIELCLYWTIYSTTS